MCVSQDLLGADWAVRSASGPADATAAVSSCALRASSAAHTEPEKNCSRQPGARSAAVCDGAASRSSTHAAGGQTVALGLRQLPPSASSSSSSALPPPLNTSAPNLAPLQSQAGALQPCVAPDDFDDWDVDLADLDECDRQMGQLPQPPPAPPAAVPPSTAKSLRPPTCGAAQSRPEHGLRELSSARQAPGSSGYNPGPRTPSTPAVRPAPPPQIPRVFPGSAATSPSPSSTPQTLTRPPQRAWASPAPSPHNCGLFETVSPAAPRPSPSPHPLHTPVLTNRLVQLVSASNKLPKKRPRSEGHQPRTRRFPGPAGLLPQQVSASLSV